jgi:hypothetical protein
MMQFRLVDENNLLENGSTDFSDDRYSFITKFKNFDEFDEFTCDDPDYELFMDKMECDDEDWCGVHDFCGDEHWIGFSSYEIKDFETAITKWKEFFESKNKLVK